MRKSFSLAVLFLLTLTLFAQKIKDVPAFGKVEKADLELKECSIDKDAEAMYLFDQGIVYYKKGLNTLFEMHESRRIRLKILKEKGFNHANIKLQYYSHGNYEKIIDIDAIAYNLDEAGNIVITKVEKKAFYRQQLNAYYSAITFTFPDIKPRSIIEYRYEKVREAWSNIDPWVFQHDIPIKFSSFNITLPEYFHFTTTQQISFPVENKKDQVSQSILLPDGNINFTATEHSYKMRDLPSLKEEPFMGAARDYLQKIEFQLSTITVPGALTQNFRNTWPALTKELMEHQSFGMQLKKNLDRDAELTGIMAIKSKTDKLLNIYRYVQKISSGTGQKICIPMG